MLDDISKSVAAAYEKIESAAPAETPVETPAPVESEAPAAATAPEADKTHKAADQPRKDDGKWDKKPKDAKPAKDAGAKIDQKHVDDETKRTEKALAKAEADAAPLEQKDEPKAAPIQAPKHWSTARKADFAKLPADAQKFVADGYAQLEREHSQRLQALQPHLKLAETAQKWGTYLHQIGVDGATALNAMLTAEAKLRLGTPAEKKAALQKLATDYGIPIEAPQQGEQQQEYVDPQVQALRQQLAQQEQWIQRQTQNQQQAWRDQQKQHRNGLVTQIASFADEKDGAGNPVHPHFEDVADDMAILAEAEQAAGRKVDLKTLYDKAVWSNPQIRQRMLDERREAAVAKAREEAQTRLAASQRAAVPNAGAPSGTSSAPPRFKSPREATEWAWEHASQA